MGHVKVKCHYIYIHSYTLFKAVLKYAGLHCDLIVFNISSFFVEQFKVNHVSLE
jgi:hypothetical protein